jgi:SAM-dependent methyltransferase
MKPASVAVRACRSCGHAQLSPVLSLGNTPLANQLLTEAELCQEEARYPLDLAYCAACSLLQITDTVPAEFLFSDYVYFSSFSDSMLSHARDLVTRTCAERAFGADDLVIEIASNDGYLLQYYRDVGIKVLGVEPAQNIAVVARERGIPTITEFFGQGLAERLVSEGKTAAVVHANNVMAHVPDINGFAAGLRAVLAPEGLGLIEVPYVREMISRCEFDTIYHEHIFYFSLTALSSLFARHDLKVLDVEVIPLHGGSLLLSVAREGARAPTSTRVAHMLDEERRLGMASSGYYEDFSRRVQALRGDLRRVLSELKSRGARLAAYGAAAKGSTLLNYAGIGRETLDFVVDRSPHKQGKFMPGVHLRIRAPAALLEERPDYVLLLTWNFKEEILAQQEAFRQRGGKFIVPLPVVAVV